MRGNTGNSCEDDDDQVTELLFTFKDMEEVRFWEALHGYVLLVESAVLMFLLCLCAGPGCSSMGLGWAYELGPFHIRENGTGLETNIQSWNRCNFRTPFREGVRLGFWRKLCGWT